MSETAVLALCFIITFGFIAYKTFGIIKSLLNDYRRKIEDNINESERLKLKAVNELDVANRRAREIDDLINKNNNDAIKKMQDIRKELTDQLNLSMEKLINENKNKIEIEKKELMLLMQNDIKKNILSIIDKYVANIPVAKKLQLIEKIIENM